MSVNSTRRATICDDDKDILHVTKGMLQRLGFDVHAFNDPILALEHIVTCKDCTLLVTDIKMPQMNGFELARRVRDFRPDMTVVAMTAFEESKIEYEAMSPTSTIAGLVKKPFRQAELAEILKAIKATESRSGGPVLSFPK